MMKCPNCGGDRYLNDGGCRNCGSDLSGLEIVEENSLNQNVKPTQAKLSRLCFAGFVLSVSSFIFAVAGYMALPVFDIEPLFCRRQNCAFENTGFTGISIIHNNPFGRLSV